MRCMNLLSTLRGSLLENFFPEGWDLAKMDGCCEPDDEYSLESSLQHPWVTACKPQKWWHKGFKPIPCDTVADFDMMMGHEIAMEIKRSKDAGHPLTLVLPVGPMGMYRWAVYFLTE